MVTIHFSRKVFAVLVATFLFGFAFAQDGDAFGSYLGKTADDPSIKRLESDFKCEMVNDAHYRSNGGIELMFKDGKLNQINLYKNSKAYGDFGGKLPHGLTFGMGPGDVKRLLGKPTLEYNGSGYSEFDLKDYGVSCWFDGGHLSQIILNAKTSN